MWIVVNEEFHDDPVIPVGDRLRPQPEDPGLARRRQHVGVESVDSSALAQKVPGSIVPHR